MHNVLVHISRRFVRLILKDVHRLSPHLFPTGPRLLELLELQFILISQILLAVVFLLFTCKSVSLGDF